MTVPETTIHEQHNLISWQNRIRRSREIFSMMIWLEAKSFEQLRKPDLRGSVFPFDLGHDFRTLGLAIDVSHRIFPCDQNV
jgi:hypothetical protein